VRKIIRVIHDIEFLPKPSDEHLILSDELPPIDLITSPFALAFVDDKLLMTNL
jgi:hypothetical protein